ncbi:MAG TPA: Smr/MutS family protein, partial [Anaerolineales bacterium]|nr:Smr/MutS family protein [Anaerolineales bacterium]
QSEGVLTAISEADAEVQIGSLRVRAKLQDLDHRAAASVVPAAASTASGSVVSSPPARTRSSGGTSAPMPGMEVNLRGKLVEDGLDELERYLEKAYGAGLPFVRIIHGKGTGKLRDAVRLALKDNAYVSSFEEAQDNEGGAGVTIAKLARG